MVFYTGDQAKIFYGGINVENYKTVMHKSSNFSFSKKYIQYQESETNVTNLLGKYVTFNLRPLGDLLNEIYVEVHLEGYSDSGVKYSVDNFNHALLKEIKFEIDGLTIDKQTGKFMQIDKELYDRGTDSVPALDTNDLTYGGTNTSVTANAVGYRNLVTNYNYTTGNVPLVFGSDNATTTALGSSYKYKKVIYIPLRFYFNKTVENSLPLVSLKNNDCKIKILLEKLNNIKGSLSGLEITSMKLLCKFFHLDKDNVRRFKTNKLVYLINQVQEFKDKTDNTHTKTFLNQGGQLRGGVLGEKNYDLKTFKNYIRYITWVVVDDSETSAGTGPCYFRSLSSSTWFGDDAHSGSVLLKINHQKYNNMETMPMSYFTRITPYNKFLNIPHLDRIGVYSFETSNLFLENGCLDFGNKQKMNINLVLSNNKIETIQDKFIYFYAVSYNILTINNGTINLEFSY